MLLYFHLSHFLRLKHHLHLFLHLREYAILLILISLGNLWSFSELGLPSSLYLKDWKETLLPFLKSTLLRLITILNVF